MSPHHPSGPLHQGYSCAVTLVCVGVLLCGGLFLPRGEVVLIAALAWLLGVWGSDKVRRWGRRAEREFFRNRHDSTKGKKDDAQR